MNKSIDDALGIMPLDPSESNSISKSDNAIIPKDENVVKDLGTVRTNIIKVIETGAEAMEEMAVLASQAEETKAYDTIATLMIATLRANKDLLEFQKIQADLLNKEKSKGEDKKDPTHVTNNLTISADDLLEKYLAAKEANEANVIDHD